MMGRHSVCPFCCIAAGYFFFRKMDKLVYLYNEDQIRMYAYIVKGILNFLLACHINVLHLSSFVIFKNDYICLHVNNAHLGHRHSFIHIL